MIENAVLWSSDANLPASRLVGMTLVERQLFLLARSGIRRAWAAFAKPGQELRVPDGLEIHWSAPVTAPAVLGAPYVLLSARHILRKEVLKSILSRTYPESTCWLDDTGHPALQILEPSDSGSVAAFPLKEAVGAGRKLDPSSYLFLRDASAIPLASKLLMSHARKATDGLMAHYFDRALSLKFTSWILETPLTPNFMTLTSTAIGVIGAAQFFWGNYFHSLCGALLIWLHTVLDGCDGEMARLTFRESRWGRFLDFWGDNVVHLALFSAMACGLSQGADAMRWLGISAGLGSFGSAMLVYRADFSYPSSKLSGLGDVLRRLEILLAQRDFIYLLVACAAADRINYFLWATGVGAPIYLFILIYLQQATKDSRKAGEVQDAVAAAVTVNEKIREELIV